MPVYNGSFAAPYAVLASVILLPASAWRARWVQFSHEFKETHK